MARNPPLAAAHEANGARVIEFGGWDMPVEFNSIREEHTVVREEVGIFDVSHMGEIRVSGLDAAELMTRLTTNDAVGTAVGRAQYAAITDSEGIMLDDTVFYRLGEEEFLFVPNAGHDEEVEARWVEHRDEWGLDCDVENETEGWGMFAVQGPDSPELLDSAADSAVSETSRFAFTETTIEGADCLVARTGYTGEDGFEVLCPWDEAEAVWNALECQPCGLGARDTLRMEAGFLLSGQDFHPEENPRTPFQARIGFAVDLETEFVGRDALAREKEEGPAELFVGVALEERGIPRHGYPVVRDGERVGEVTSGTMSPTLGEPIGLGYVRCELAEPGTQVAVEIRGEEKRARVESPRFVEGV
ncbi:glycine cleavage system aminomethyltransferase GcvT [Natronorarus salvus]|uniref:glycine cleavage system aminomethyltransferase GcvT n=1 Tax=Natronorarus salvus TaxID=3117733 RepID=UPI002F2635CF